jgi:hypothetical protein
MAERGMPISCLPPHGILRSGEASMLMAFPITAQANFIPRGCILRITVNYAGADGVGAAQIIGAWAENCRNLQQLPDMTVRAYRWKTPKTLHCMTTYSKAHLAAIKHDPSLWQLLGIQNPQDDRPAKPRVSSGISSKAMVSVLFMAPEEAVTRLKTSYSQQRRSNGY